MKIKQEPIIDNHMNMDINKQKTKQKHRKIAESDTEMNIKENPITRMNIKQ